MKFAMILIATLFSINTYAASTCTPEKINGVYKGMISGGGTWGETVFFHDAQGMLSGVYFMHFDYTSPGHFTNLALTDGVMTGTWHDEFGEGEVEFAFADECANFAGTWNKSAPWDGAKTVN